VQLGADRQLIVSAHRAAAGGRPARDGNARFTTASKKHVWQSLAAQVGDIKAGALNED